ncbi:hypothetical protein M8C21_000496, partial [Ambrosia artemisiifolia]
IEGSNVGPASSTAILIRFEKHGFGLRSAREEAMSLLTCGEGLDFQKSDSGPFGVQLRDFFVRLFPAILVLDIKESKEPLLGLG